MAGRTRSSVRALSIQVTGGTQCITEPEINLTVAKNNSWRVTKNNSKTVPKKLFRKGAKNNQYIVKKIICRVCQNFTEDNEKKARQNVTIYIYSKIK